MRIPAGRPKLRETRGRRERWEPTQWVRSSPRGGAGRGGGGRCPRSPFPGPSLWWFAYVALVPWLLLVRSAPTGRRAAVEGWLGGTGFMIAVHHWLMPSLHVFIVLLAALLGLLWAPWGWLVRRCWAGPPSPAAGGAALAWCRPAG